MLLTKFLIQAFVNYCLEFKFLQSGVEAPDDLFAVRGSSGLCLLRLLLIGHASGCASRLISARLSDVLSTELRFQILFISCRFFVVYL